MIKELLPRLLIGALLLALAAWLLHSTEWQEIQVPTPARGEALRDPYYATQQLLRELGGTVAKRQDLNALPPPQGRLMLSGQHWDLFAGRAEGLQAWVQGGGHLIIPGTLVEHDALEDWLPVVSADRLPEPRSSAAAPGTQPPRGAGPTENTPDSDCRPVSEPPGVSARYVHGRSFKACVWASWRQYVPAESAVGQPLWRIDGARGTEMIRMPYGQGSVTVIGNGVLLHNEHLLRGDNPLLAASALQAQTGAVFWFVAEESRPGLLTWLWTRGWMAIVLGLLALALAVWRATPRFGPLVLPASAHRRSMTEQVRGTGRFLQAHGASALHAAQLRALHEAAVPRLPRYAALGSAAQAASLAQATGLDADALARAMQRRTRPALALATDLGLLERARRRLHERPPASTDL